MRKICAASAGVKQHIVNFSPVKQEERGRGRKQQQFR